eukprot:8163204-Pyramimonas_sp.AAC.1
MHTYRHIIIHVYTHTHTSGVARGVPGPSEVFPGFPGRLRGIQGTPRRGPGGPHGGSRMARKAGDTPGKTHFWQHPHTATAVLP